MLNPRIDILTEAEIEPVVAVLRASTDLGDANRTLRREFPQWGLAKRLAAQRQAQNRIFNDWQKSPARKRREALARGHAAGSLNEPREKEE